MDSGKNISQKRATRRRESGKGEIMETKNWWKDHLAFSIKFEWLWWIVVFVAVGGCFLFEACWLLWVVAPKACVVVGAVLVVVAVLLIAAFTLEIKGKPFFVFENVPAMNALVLRWLFPSKESQRPGYDARADKTLCVSLYSGLAIYSPWLFKREALVDLKTRVLATKPLPVNDREGNIIYVDVQLSWWPVNVISYFLNVANNPEEMERIIIEYLQTALRRMASVGNKTLKLRKSDGTIEKEFAGWECTTLALTMSDDDAQRRMGQLVTWLLKHWLSSGGDEQYFGIEVKVKITSIQAPEILAAAQEAKAAAKTEVDQVTIQAKGYAAMATTIAGAITAMVPEKVRTRLFEVIQDPTTPPETVGKCAEFLRGVFPNATFLTAALSLIPAARDIMEAARGGKRAKVAGSGESTGGGEQTVTQGGGGPDKGDKQQRGKRGR